MKTTQIVLIVLIGLLFASCGPCKVIEDTGLYKIYKCEGRRYMIRYNPHTGREYSKLPLKYRKKKTWKY